MTIFAKASAKIRAVPSTIPSGSERFRGAPDASNLEGVVEFLEASRKTGRFRRRFRLVSVRFHHIF